MLRKFTLSLLLVFIFTYCANAVTFYWRSGLPANSLYTNADNWESVPGSGIPANGAFAPSSIDDVVFPTGNTLQNINMGTNAAARNLTILASGRLTFLTGNITIYGNLSSNGNHYFALDNSINFNGIGSHTIDMGDDLTHIGNGTNINFNGPGSYSLVNHSLNTLSGININESTFISNGLEIICNQLAISNGAVIKIINLQNSKVTATQLRIYTKENNFNFIDTEISTNSIYLFTEGSAKAIDGIKSITMQGVSPQWVLNDDFSLLTLNVKDFNINGTSLLFRATLNNARINLNVENLNLLKVADISIDDKLTLNLSLKSITSPTVCSGLSGVSSVNNPLNLNTLSFINTNAIAFKNVNFSGAGLNMPTPYNLGQNTGTFTTTGTPISQTFHWVGGTGNWNDPSKWSVMGSGGAPQTSSGCLPTANNNVVFDTNSFNASNQIITIAGNGNNTAYAKSISWTAPNRGNLQGGKLNISASADFTGCMEVSSDLNFVGGVGNYTISSGSNFTYSSSSITFKGTSTYTLNDHFIAGNSTSIYINSGSFISNGKTISCQRLHTESLPANATSIRNIDISNSTINLTGPNQYAILIGAPHLNTFLANGSTINIMGLGNIITTAPISLHTITFNDINFTNESGLSKIENNGFKNFEANNIRFNSDAILSNLDHIANTFTVNNYDFKPGKTYLFTPNSTTYNVNNAINTSLGSCSPLITLGSEINGTKVKLHKPIGLFTINGALVKDIKAVGQPLQIIGIDGGNNLNVNTNLAVSKNFYWVGGTGNWHNGSNWSIGTSGGNPTINNIDNCIPSVQDNVFFDTNSFTANGQTVTIAADASFKNMFWDSSAGAKSPILFGDVANKLNIYGSITLVAGMNYSFAGSLLMLGKDLTANSQAITSNSVPMISNINLDGGGRYDILGDLSLLSKSINFNSGQFYTNANTISAGSMFLNVTGTNVADIGGSKLYLDAVPGNAPYYASHNIASNWNATGSTIYASGTTFNIIITNNVPITYHNMVVSGGTPWLIGSSAVVNFNNLDWQTDVSKMNGNYNITNLTYKLSSNNIINEGNTITIANTLTANGTPCNPIIIRSTSLTNPVRLIADLCNFDLKYARLTGITAGSCTPPQNKVIGDDVNGNSNWAFTPIITSNYLISSIPDLRLKCNAYPYTLSTVGFNTGATSILWSDGSTGVNLIVSEPGTYGVTVTFGASCTITDEITLGMTTPPLINPVTLNACETTMGSGTSIFDLNAANPSVVTNPTNYTISYHANYADANLGVDALISLYNSSEKVIYVRVVDNATSCFSIEDINLNINDLPFVAPIGNIGSIPIGARRTLTNATVGGIWSSSNPGVATIDATGIITGISLGTTTINYTLTNANGCIAQVSHPLNVNSVTVINPIIGNANLCVGHTTTLSNATPSGIWSTSNAAIATVAANGTVTAVSAGIASISYTVTDAFGSITAKFDITVNLMPIVEQITSSGGANSCVGKTIQLANATSGGIWSSSNEAVATINSAGLIIGFMSGKTIISYRVTNDSGCSTMVTYELSLNALPIIGAITGIAEICIGTNSQLYNTITGGVWLSSNPAVATINNQGLVTGVSLGSATITYEITGIGGCTKSVSYLITVNDLPTATISYHPTEYQAVGIANVIQKGQTGGGYSSSPLGLSLNVITGEINLENSKPNQIYTITYTFSNGKCTNTTSTSIKINSIPATITYNQATYCALGSLSVTQTGPIGGVYTSDNNGLKINAITGEINLALSTPGIYKVTYTYQDGSIIASTITTITVNSLPILTLTSDLIGELSKGDIVTLTATGGATYSWTGEDIISGQGTNQVKVRPRVKNTYTVTATNANGCSSSLSIILDVLNDRKIIPNNVITPNGDCKNDVWIVVNLDYYPNNKVTIYDRGGRKLYSVSGYKNDWDGNYNGAPLAEGAYVYVIDSGAGIGLLRGTVNIIRTQR